MNQTNADELATTFLYKLIAKVKDFSEGVAQHVNFFLSLYII